jgi:hypothetical protein
MSQPQAFTRLGGVPICTALYYATSSMQIGRIICPHEIRGSLLPIAAIQAAKWSIVRTERINTEPASMLKVYVSGTQG